MADDSEQKATPKFGAGHAGAMLRLGLNELRNAVYNDGASAVQKYPETGLAGTVTQSEVRDARMLDVQGGGVFGAQPSTESPAPAAEPPQPEPPKPEGPDMDR